MNALQSQEPLQRRMTLDVELGADPLRGVLHSDGVSQPFEGWLALVTALGRLVDGGPDREKDQ